MGDRRSGTGLADPNEAARVFTEVRPRLFGIACRMPGSVSEAGDLVQDAWLRWQGYDRDSAMGVPGPQTRRR